MSPGSEIELAPRAGRHALGEITIADRVVVKIAARAAAENPDAGAAAARLLGRPVLAADRLPGVRSKDLDALPKTTVQVDGSKAFVTVELAVRWPSPVGEIAAAVRARVRDRIGGLAGLQADEVHIVVADLVTDITPPPRVR